MTHSFLAAFDSKLGMYSNLMQIRKDSNRKSLPNDRLFVILSEKKVKGLCIKKYIRPK